MLLAFYFLDLYHMLYSHILAISCWLAFVLLGKTCLFSFGIIAMQQRRIFAGAEFVVPAEIEPIRSVVSESADAVIVMWHVLPGQCIRPHVHPGGQDSWVVLAGAADYWLDASGKTRSVAAGDIVVAHAGQVHGAFNRGEQPFQFVSVVSPGDAGYELA